MFLCMLIQSPVSVPEDRWPSGAVRLSQNGEICKSNCDSAQGSLSMCIQNNWPILFKSQRHQYQGKTEELVLK